MQRNENDPNWHKTENSTEALIYLPQICLLKEIHCYYFLAEAL